jgi:hypothetical protein
MIATYEFATKTDANTKHLILAPRAGRSSAGGLNRGQCGSRTQRFSLRGFAAELALVLEQPENS